MVKATFFQDGQGRITGFECRGHADYADGNDIVCAGTSALVISCINSLEELTEDRFSCESEAGSGSIILKMDEDAGEQSQLLLKSLALGLEGIEESYEENIDVIFEEV
ncbi:MAG: ribosomal-processing cysteine protease Prp [Clostridiales bacterium]|nr:ribosomal-processing cysteine protease Prp [Clostridiales bacterium]